MRLIIFFLAVTVFSGCATTQQATPINQLQIKVAQLERRLDDREQDIQDLKYEVEGLVSQLEETHASSAPAQVEKSMVKAASSNLKPATEEEQGFIRVNTTVQDIQQALKNAGYYQGAIDGKPGPKTKEAVSAFQGDHGLTVDGIIGKKTWAELNTYLEQ